MGRKKEKQTVNESEMCTASATMMRKNDDGETLSGGVTSALASFPATVNATVHAHDDLPKRSETFFPFATCHGHTNYHINLSASRSPTTAGGRLENEFSK